MAEEQPIAVKRHLPRYVVPAVVALLLLFHAALAISASREHSAAYDEVAFVTAGYTYWAFGDYRLHPENGLVTQLWVGLPIWLMAPHWPGEAAIRDWAVSDVWRVAQRFLYESGNDADAILLAGRSATAVASAGLGLLVFFWSRTLFGNAAGVISLALYAFSPTLLAHGGLATGDVLTALLLLGATGALWRLMHRIDAWSLALVAICLPLLVLAKTSWVLMMPIALVLAVVKVAAGRPQYLALPTERAVVSRLGQAGRIAACFLGLALFTYAAIWAAFGFRYAAGAGGPGRQERFHIGWDAIFSDLGGLTRLVEFALAHRVLPEAFVYGTSFTVSYSVSRQAFLCGNYSLEGWWWFFPFAFAVKSTFVEWLSLLAIIGVAIARRASLGPALYRLAPLLTLAGVYGAFSVTSSLNIGHRHILPLYPVLFILAGGAGAWLFTRWPRGRVLIGAALLFAAIEAALFWPHHLAYFNAATGGPSRGYRLLVDSSLDWGQDLPALKRWLDREGFGEPEAPPVFFTYFGTGSPTYYGIQTRRLPGVPMLDTNLRLSEQRLEPGVYCLSATHLQGLYLPTFGQWCVDWEADYQHLKQRIEAYDAIRADPNRTAEAERMMTAEFRQLLMLYQHLRLGRLYTYLLQREPDAWAGYSITIYKVDAAELRAALEGPPAELYPDRFAQ